MNDTGDRIARYFRQQQELGETSYVMTDVTHAIKPKQRASVTAQELRQPTSQGPSRRLGAPKDAEGANEFGKWRKGAPSIPGSGIDIPMPSADLFAQDPLRELDLGGLADAIRACEKCGLCKERQNAVPGEGPDDADLMVVGEGPGAKEDAQGRPFVGRAGELLDGILKAIDCPRKTVYVSNIVKCRPPGNRNPEREEVEACLPYLYRQIALVRPKVIIALGSVAASSLLETRGTLGSLRNKVHSFRGIPTVVTYHPAALLRNPNWKKPTWDDVRIARHLLADQH